MKIDMNKDFEEKYKSTRKGLTTGEIVSCGAALAAAGTVIIIVWRLTGLPINVCVYFGVPVMIPIAAVAFYKYQGSSMIKLLKDLRYYLETRNLPYEAGEYDNSAQCVFTVSQKEVDKDGGI